MSGPPYHLRKNKAADRFALIEAIRYLFRLGGKPEEFTYYGFGGPYLEDIRLIYTSFPEMDLVSIEGNPNVIGRQKFHLPCSKIDLRECKSGDLISDYEPKGKKAIFWLDYTDLHYRNFQEFEALLTQVEPGSMIKITLLCCAWNYHTRRQIETFHREFSEILQPPDLVPPQQNIKFAAILKQMIEIAVQRALPATSSWLTFHPVSSFYYKDSVGIFTLTGVVWPRDKIAMLDEQFRTWDFADLSWDKPPFHIDIPDLSTKERLHLQNFLPCSGNRGEYLRGQMEYELKENTEETKIALEQYALFHRYLPFFLRGTP